MKWEIHTTNSSEINDNFELKGSHYALPMEIYAHVTLVFSCSRISCELCIFPRVKWPSLGADYCFSAYRSCCQQQQEQQVVVVGVAAEAASVFLQMAWNSLKIGFAKTWKLVCSATMALPPISQLPFSSPTSTAIVFYLLVCTCPTIKGLTIFLSAKQPYFLNFSPNPNTMYVCIFFPDFRTCVLAYIRSNTQVKLHA